MIDASDARIGGVLCQEVNDMPIPVAYMSKKLEPHQRKYIVIEKEALAVISSIEKFEVYLHGCVVVYNGTNIVYTLGFVWYFIPAINITVTHTLLIIKY